MPGFVGVRELGLLLVIVLLFAGTRRIPEVGRSLGRGLREFKDGMVGRDTGDQKETVTRGRS